MTSAFYLTLYYDARKHKIKTKTQSVTMMDYVLCVFIYVGK